MGAIYERVAYPYVSLERTRSGLLAIWETGGGRRNTGSAVIVAGPSGEALRPICVRGGGALFVIRPGMVTISADQRRGDFTIRIHRIIGINPDDTIDQELLTKLQMGEWSDSFIAEKFASAIAAAREKAMCYHCRHSHYAAPKS